MGIHEAIAAVMRDCAAVGKDSRNPQQGYKYRGIDAVMNAVNPALTKNKVFVVPEILDTKREERTTSKGGLLLYTMAKVKYTFYAEDGSSVSAVVIGEGMDSGDKSSNKAMSAAFKYALFQVLCIPTEDMVDVEADSPQPEPKERPRPAPEDAEIGRDGAMKLERELNAAGVNIGKLCEMKGVGGLEKLTVSQANIIARQIEEHRKGVNK